VTFTYSSTSISTDLAKVRTLVGDTNSNDPLLTDEQINFFLAETADIYLAAANAVRRGILPQLARRIDRTGTGFSATRSQMSQHYRDLAADLESKAYLGLEVTFGGTSTSDADNLESDTDFIQPTFQSGQHRNE